VTVVGSGKPDLEVRPIRKGMLATYEVGGEFVRAPAPCDGVLIETERTTVLVPLTDLTRALGELTGPERAIPGPPPGLSPSEPPRWVGRCSSIGCSRALRRSWGRSTGPRGDSDGSG
jgi:hypothetical protein